ncbi:MAG: putative signal peptide protein [Massilia sp.]|nr:putative signal peptide protein [Massilia sp.]
MNILTKALAIGALALAASQSASASTQVRLGVYSGVPVQQVQPVYGPAPGYYVAGPGYGYVEPEWRGRHDWRARREAELRREEWLRREHWRREQWRRHHWREEHRHGDGYWDGRR